MYSREVIEKAFCEEYGDFGLRECFFAPGRVNLIGEHIDYNGGLVLPGAVSLGIYGCARRRDDDLVRLRSRNEPGETVLGLQGTILSNPDMRWANYPAGVIQALRQEGYALKGCDILFMSDLPEGAGLSSSAALEVLVAYMMLDLGGVKDIDRRKLAQLCQRVENEFVGVNCGIMDQFAVALGKAEHAILLNTDTLDYAYVPFRLDGYKLLILDTRKQRELSESKYNERRQECDQALALIRQRHPVKTLVEADLSDLEAVKDRVLKRRARHAITEHQRVLQSVQALKNGDLVTFGKLLNASHLSLKDDYAVTGFELDTIVAEAWRTSGCLGARMIGAGFGGCAIALVKDDALDAFAHSVESGYGEKTQRHPAIHPCIISDGVRRLG